MKRIAVNNERAFPESYVIGSRNLWIREEFFNHRAMKTAISIRPVSTMSYCGGSARNRFSMDMRMRHRR